MTSSNVRMNKPSVIKESQKFWFNESSTAQEDSGRDRKNEIPFKKRLHSIFESAFLKRAILSGFWSQANLSPRRILTMQFL